MHLCFLVKVTVLQKKIVNFREKRFNLRFDKKNYCENTKKNLQLRMKLKEKNYFGLYSRFSSECEGKKKEWI